MSKIYYTVMPSLEIFVSVSDTSEAFEKAHTTAAKNTATTGEPHCVIKSEEGLDNEVVGFANVKAGVYLRVMALGHKSGFDFLSMCWKPWEENLEKDLIFGEEIMPV
jgi:hypothetical protein